MSDRPQNHVTTTQVVTGGVLQTKSEKNDRVLVRIKIQFQTPGFDFYMARGLRRLCMWDIKVSGFDFLTNQVSGFDFLSEKWYKCEERQDSILNIRPYPPLMLVYTFFL